MPKAVVEQALQLVGGQPLVSLAPFRAKRAGLVITTLPQTKPSIVRKSETAMRDRLTALGSRLGELVICGHETAEIAAAIARLEASGHDPVLVFGASAIVDRGDVVPAGLVRAGGTVVHLGVTVSPLGKPLPHLDAVDQIESAAPASADDDGDAGPDAAPGVICLFSDLTSVVELEEQLRLKETLARLGELTAGLAHEFRNGLATIHGYSRLIDVDALTPKYRPYVEGIRQEADALGRVVTNFLSFARPENVALSRVDLEAVVRRAADDLRYELPAETKLTVDGTFAEVLGDEVMLRQVFSNLVRNAVDACEGAAITPDIRIRGWVDTAHHSCRVSVEDNGPGIPEAAREKIFQPFFTTRSQGTGLGLAIVQKIVVMHNGRVIVADARGGGASIQISIPTAGA